MFNMNIKCRIIILEGITDEAFLIEYINKIYDVRYREWKINKPKFSKIFNFETINNFLLVTKIAGSKDNILPIIKTYIRDISTGMLPIIEKILILKDYNNLTKNQIFENIYNSLKEKYGEENVTNKDYGYEVLGIPIHIIPVGNITFKHQCEEWSHALEDYLIEAIQEGQNDDIKKAYENVSIEAIGKGISIGLKTCCKSPLCITMAFTDSPESIAGFYRKIVGKNINIIDEILERTSFKADFDGFLR